MDDDKADEEDGYDSDEDFEDIDICYCELFKEVSSISRYVPKIISIENICNRDVLNVSHHFTKLAEVIVEETRDQAIFGDSCVETDRMQKMRA